MKFQNIILAFGLMSAMLISCEKSSPVETPEAIDLGLSVKWASFNLGASKPEDYGGYYQWAGTKDVTSTSIRIDYSNCPYHTGSLSYTGWKKYNTKSSYGTVDNKVVLEARDDVAHVKLGGKWRMPTIEEWEELKNNCSMTNTTLNGKRGYKVRSKKTGYTDNWIFLPSAGFRDFDSIKNDGRNVSYWSSSLSTDYPYCALDITEMTIGTVGYPRSMGLTVRPVSE